MNEQPLTLRGMALRYMVTKQVIVEWVRVGFMPRPDWRNGEPIWWPGSVEAHDCIVHSFQGRGDDDKPALLSAINLSNGKGLYPYGQRKRRGRPRKQPEYLDAPIEPFEYAGTRMAAGPGDATRTRGTNTASRR